MLKKFNSLKFFVWATSITLMTILAFCGKLTMAYVSGLGILTGIFTAGRAYVQGKNHKQEKKDDTDS